MSESSVRNMKLARVTLKFDPRNLFFKSPKLPLTFRPATGPEDAVEYVVVPPPLSSATPMRS